MHTTAEDRDRALVTQRRRLEAAVDSLEQSDDPEAIRVAAELLERLQWGRDRAA
jgi:hypothetical protein